MERKMNRGYYIPMLTGTVGMILHFAYLPLLKYAHGADYMALLAGKVHIAGGVFISLTFTAMTWVLSMEGHTKGAAWSVVGHIVLLASIPLHSYGLTTASEILYQSVVVVFAPVMLYFMVDVFRSYRPGGATANEWMRWRSDICDVVNTNDRETRAALAAMQEQIRQATDTVRTLNDGYTTALRHATDKLTTLADTQRAELEEVVNKAVERKINADDRRIQRQANPSPRKKGGAVSDATE